MADMSEQVQGDFSHLEELTNLRVALGNEKNRAEAAEMKITEMHTKLVQQDAILQQAWLLRDEAIKERQEAEAALRSSLRLVAYLIKEIWRGISE